jgi:Acyl-protein synthetase, LuxE
MIEELEKALAQPPYSLPQAQREDLLLLGFNRLTRHHYERCLPYRRIIDGYWDGRTESESLGAIPYLPVSIFKSQLLQSVPDGDVRLTLTSSGTTGQAVSRIRLDALTSTIQQRALANSLMHVLGKQRLPMLVVDTDAVFKDPKSMSARGAGVLGLMRYGRDHVFALTPDLEPDFGAVHAFLEGIKDKPFFMFGFTFMVWSRFYELFRDRGLDLSNATLIHSGGWKKLAEQAVSNEEFRRAFGEAFDLTRIYNFYGMVEQIGTIFMEGPGGLLFPPNFADVIVRNTRTFEIAPLGEPGLIEVLSLLPHSYPGHSVLTEDLGVVEVVSDGREGWAGKGIRILGRLPRSELRGCSDVIGMAA